MLICVGSGCLKGRGGVGERLFSDAEGLVSPSCAQSPKASAASAGARLYSAPEYEGARSDGVVMGVGFGKEPSFESDSSPTFDVVLLLCVLGVFHLCALAVVCILHLFEFRVGCVFGAVAAELAYTANGHTRCGTFGVTRANLGEFNQRSSQRAAAHALCCLL